MSTGPDERPRSRAQAEQDAIRRLVERLGRRFPDLPADEIERAVRAKYAEFAGSRIRTFVPTLVERSVRADLADKSDR